MSSSHTHQESLSSYQDYPSKVSLLTDHYSVDKTPKGVNTAAESNSRAVISALLGLQEKIRRLEIERTEAEGNLKSLANETTHYRDLIKRQHTQSSYAPSSKQSKELQGQLASAESRSQLLEKQLEYMRNMVRSAEQERNNALRQQELQSMQHSQIASDRVRTEEVKIQDLEREHAKLKASQALAESKIQDLQNKVKEEKHHREILQSRGAELQASNEFKKMSSGAVPSHTCKRKKTKKKKSQVSSTTVSSKFQSHSKQPYTARHLRLKMENVPFVAGKAITPSHNVNVNMQNLIAMMKTHNSAWCDNATLREKPVRRKAKASKPHALSSAINSDSDLADLLLGLQDEFGQLAFKHQEITKQIQETRDLRLQDELEQELAQIYARLEAKGDQINKLKKHKQKMAKEKMNSVRRSKLEGRVWPSPSAPSCDGEVKVVTTVKTKGKGITAKSVKVITPDSKSNQLMLHNMKTLQTSLRKDDVNWD